MKRILILAIAAITATSLLAAPTTTKRAGAKKGPVKTAAVDEDEEATSGKEAKVNIDVYPKLGHQACLPSPSIPGATTIGKAYTKPRQWIVLETKYTTFAKLQEQLTFEWHVLLDAKNATLNKGNRDGYPRYSYFTTSVTYHNIPNGGHAASVCLHPSYLERYGEPCAVGLVISNAKGEVLAGDCWAEGEKRIQALAKPSSLEEAFWNNQKIMGDKEIERRQGLVDRSKTIWALVNPDDFEYVAQ